MRTLFFLVIILCFVDDALGACFAQSVSGTECTAPNGVMIPAGAGLKIPEQCLDCTCSSHGPNESLLGCCGYGIHGGVFAPPTGCKVVADEDGCSMKIVQIADESLPC